MTRTRVGVDVGGTFTDVVVVADGRLTVAKAPSTPDAPADGVLDGLARAGAAADDVVTDAAADDVQEDVAAENVPEEVTADDGGAAVAPDEATEADASGADSLAWVDDLVHGTTVATNAVLERTWADAALVTNEGFRDVLEIGRQERPALYDLTAEKPEPVVPRDRRHEVPGRLDERGEVERPLEEDAVRDVAATLAAASSPVADRSGDAAGSRDDATGAEDDADVESVAVCLLFAYEDDAHERRVAELLAEALDVPVTTSSEVLPEVREYERTLATALNAALLPVVDDYLGELRDGLAERGCAAPLDVMTSAGGLVAAEQARERPVETLLSGPAAGVRGAAHVAGLAGVEDLLTMDMGGTSCDVSLVTGGEPAITTERDVGGYEVALPAVDVHTIGAGGGSIAWLDRGGALRVGPRSAGAEPGPVCYGRGGTEPTVTDAQLLLGRIDPDALLTESLEADVDAVEAAVRERIAEPTGQSVEAAARGILEVANASTERALRVVSVERGHDPRERALVAYGGAGPLHATALAESLEIPRVLVPRTAGALSALGLLATDRLQTASRSLVRPLASVDPATLAGALAELEAEGRERLHAGGGAGPADVEVERALDLRYVGQSSELTVPFPVAATDGTERAAASGDGPGFEPDAPDRAALDRDALEPDALEAVAERFHDRHAERFGHAAPDEPIELVTARVRVRSPIEAPPLSAPADVAASADGAIRKERPVAFGEDWPETRVYDRTLLPPEASFDGPAIVEGPESTLVVRPGQSATVDDHGTIVVEVAP